MNNFIKSANDPHGVTTPGWKPLFYTIEQGWANSGPRAIYGQPQRFQWPAEALRKIFKS